MTWAHDLRLAGLPGRRLLPGLTFLAVVGASGAITAMVARVFLSAAGVLGQGAPTVGGSLIWSLLTLCGAGTGAALSVRFAQRRAARRRREFDRFLEDATVEMIRRMRGGHSLVSAMWGAGDGAAHQSPWASAQWNLLVEKTNLGVTLEDALNELQNLVGTPRLDGFVRLVLGQRQMGGDLAEMLAETVDCEDYPALGRLITKPTTATLTTS